MDFIEFSWVPRNGNMIEVVPDFVVGGVDDLIIKKGKFIAFYDDETEYWSSNQNLLIKRLDARLTKEYNEVLKDKHCYSLKNDRVRNKFKYANSNYYKKLQDYFKLINDCNADIDIDSSIKFANSKIKKTDYSSGPLDYALEEGSTEYWDHLLNTLYAPTEQTKIEWLIGSIISGDSKSIQKFFVFYGNHGTGKSTIFNIIQAMFPKYCDRFDSARVTGNSEFALDTLRNNPLIAIEHDAKLDRIIDNSKLNSIVSHEALPMNTKGKDPYLFIPRSMLVIGTNSPVKITDEMSGLKRRLIVVEPTGNTLPPKEYDAVLEQILNFERGAIAYKCLAVYKKLGKKYFKNYDPISMSRLTNALYNFLYDTYIDLKNEEFITLNVLKKRYKEYIEENNIRNPIEGPQLREQIKNFFKEYHRDFTTPSGQKLHDVYIGLRMDKFDEEENTFKEYIESEDHSDENIYNWLAFNMNAESGIKSNLDIMLADCPAQGVVVMEDGRDRPKYKWANCTTMLKDIDTSVLHYVKSQEKYPNLIVIDFDIKNAEGNKDFKLNLEAACKWPPTYAELSKSGAGIHLHYIYLGDITLLDNKISDDIEVKIYTGDTALRRKLSKFNNLPIATLNGSLPLKDIDKGGKVYDEDIVVTEKSLRKTIIRALRKQTPNLGHTKTEMNWIHEVLQRAYDSGISYDLSDMYNDILKFAMNSTNNADYCLGLLEELKLKSKDNEDKTVDDVPPDEKVVKYEEDAPIVFFDIEIFPNLFLFGYKFMDGEVHILHNPKYYEIEEIMKYRLIGFNCLRYDNLITYAASQGYTVEQLYKLSQKIINLPKGEYIREFNSDNVKNVCYADIYDFVKKKQSLKRWEIDLGCPHDEFEWDWNEPIPESLWHTVDEYNTHDLIATELTFKANQTDFKTRQILADIAGGTINMTDNQLTAKLIFGNERKPQEYFYYRNLAEPVMHLDPDQEEFLREIFPEMMAQRHGEAQSYLPYFPGYTFNPMAKKNDEKSMYKGEYVGEGGLVRAKPGVHGYSKTFDVTSEHPHSLAAEYLFGKFTRAYYNLVAARKAIKHKRLDILEKMFDGKLMKYMTDKSEMKALSTALKTPINAVYGLTAAKFPNKCKDPRNIDNIVAKRGALFMMDLKEAVEAQGFRVFHVKTDSLKVEYPTPEIEKFIFDFGLRYGYGFEVEHEFEKICLVNDAVYIAKVTENDAEWLDECAKAKEKGEPIPTRWTATGAQFAEPYVFKKLFSHEEINFDDLCEIINVSKGALYLDFTEDLPDVSEYELVKDIRKANELGDTLTKKQLTLLEAYQKYSDIDLDNLIATGHKRQFIGKVGKFCPVVPGCGGADLMCLNDQNVFVSPSGTKGWKWMEADYVKNNHMEDCIDYRYFEELAQKAIDNIHKSTLPDEKSGYEGYGDDSEFIE